MPDLEPTYNLTWRHIGVARRAFKEHEPRDLFYRAATELVDLALRGKTSLNLAARYCRFMRIAQQQCRALRSGLRHELKFAESDRRVQLL